MQEEKDQHIKEIEREIESLYEKKREEIERREERERKEFLEKKEKELAKKLEKEGAKAKISPKLENKAKDEAKKVKGLGKKRKIRQLFNLAEKKGVAFAVTVARKIGDPYLLDVFHDVLSREGFYKKFIKK